MLPVKYRIKKDSLPLVLKKNKAFLSPFINLRVHFRSPEEPNYGKDSRVAVVVPNKILRLATRRHLAKRRMHAILEKIWAKVDPNLDILLQIVKNPLDLSFTELEKELLGLMRTAKILK